MGLSSIAARLHAAGLPEPTHAQIALLLRFPVLLDLVAPAKVTPSPLDQIFGGAHAR